MQKEGHCAQLEDSGFHPQMVSLSLDLDALAQMPNAKVNQLSALLASGNGGYTFHSSHLSVVLYASYDFL